MRLSHGQSIRVMSRGMSSSVVARVKACVFRVSALQLEQSLMIGHGISAANGLPKIELSQAVEQIESHGRNSTNIARTEMLLELSEIRMLDPSLQ